MSFASLSCLPQLEGLKIQPFEPCRPSPDACHHDPQGHDEGALAPFSQWVEALTLTQPFGADRETSSVPTKRLLPSFLRWKMEYLVQGHTAPQGQSQKSIFLALNRVFFALLDTMVINHRLLGQKYIPVQKA